MKEIQCKVKGMTCASCEVLIERALRKQSGVHTAQVDRSTETLRVECDDGVGIDQLSNALAGKGYTLHDEDTQYLSNDAPAVDAFCINRRYIEIAGALIVIAGLYFILKYLNLVPNLAVTDNMSYGFVFLIGLVAAMSTCLAMAGGLLLAVAAKFNEAYPNLTGWARFRPHAFFNVGRVFGYTAFGAGIGLLGSVITLSPWMNGLVTLFAAALMIVVGLQLLQIFPWLNKIQLKMPKSIAHKIYDASSSEGPSRKKAALLGALTFFLPCGFTQALQLYVLAQGSALTGAFTMLAFSLGTAPALLSISAFSSLTTGKVQRHFTTFAATLVIILGVMNIPFGLSLTGVAGASVGGDAVLAMDTGSAQVVRMTVRGLDYAPHYFTVKKGVPVEWVIDGRGAAGCGQVITSPSLDITERLSTTKDTIIRFTPTVEGFYPFSCAMGMTTRGAGFNVVA